MSKEDPMRTKNTGHTNSPRWPSIEAQLAHSKVTAGSKLEKLIRDNQEFEQLRPAEANDRLGFPHWLRVYWRKHHPEVAYSENDPTGGYPRVLWNIHTWMVHHQDLHAGEGKLPSISPAGPSRKADKEAGNKGGKYER